MTDGSRSSGWGAFLRLWLVMAFSYVLVKILFNFAVVGWVDLRLVAFKELLMVPLGQTLVFWFITRGRSAAPPAV